MSIAAKRRFPITVFSTGLMLAIVHSSALAQANAPTSSPIIDHLPYSNVYRVVELRRYTIKSGQRDKFARYFDEWFPEAFQQVGALAIGEFLEQARGDGFTWIRGFRSMEDFAIAKSAFYYGPVWLEHKAAVNDLILDSDNVLLLTPLDAEGIAVLPAVDPVLETGQRRGQVVAQLIKAKAQSLIDVIARAKVEFAKYRAAGARQAAVLVTLNATNTYPLHPIRTDGPFLVWIGVIPDDSAVKERLLAQIQRSAGVLTDTALLQEAPETIVMTPTPRSRLRWISERSETAAP